MLSASDLQDTPAHFMYLVCTVFDLIFGVCRPRPWILPERFHTTADLRRLIYHLCMAKKVQRKFSNDVTGDGEIQRYHVLQGHVLT